MVANPSFWPGPAIPMASLHSALQLFAAVCFCGRGGAVIFIFILRTYLEPIHEKNLNLCGIFTFCPPSVSCPCRFREMKISREHPCRWKGGRGWVRIPRSESLGLARRDK